MILIRLLMILAGLVVPQPRPEADEPKDPPPSEQYARVALVQSGGTPVPALVPVGCGTFAAERLAPLVRLMPPRPMQHGGREAQNRAVLARMRPAVESDDTDDARGNDEKTPPPVPGWRPGDPWIGVQLTPVPKPLAAHLDLDGDRLMILNIATCSPADDGGLQQYDVLVEFNGKRVADSVEKFTEAVRELKPGRTVELRVIRGAKPKTIELKVVGRPVLGQVRYKYKVEQGDEVASSELRGRLLQRMPGGQWQATPIPVPAIPPAQLEPLLRQFTVSADDEDGSLIIIEERDGVQTEIRRDEKGKITVIRRDRRPGHNQLDSRVYENRAELRKADPQAYKLYSRSGGRGAVTWGGDANAAAEHAKQLRGLMRREGGMNPVTPVPVRPEVRVRTRVSNAETTFETQADGSITVRTMDGDTENVQHFSSTDELKRKRPKLYEKYRRTVGDDGDE